MAVFNVIIQHALFNKSFCKNNNLIADSELNFPFVTKTWLGMNAPATIVSLLNVMNLRTISKTRQPTSHLVSINYTMP